jgi:hypothetical protein
MRQPEPIMTMTAIAFSQWVIRTVPGCTKTVSPRIVAVMASSASPRSPGVVG